MTNYWRSFVCVVDSVFLELIEVEDTGCGLTCKRKDRGQKKGRKGEKKSNNDGKWRKKCRREKEEWKMRDTRMLGSRVFSMYNSYPLLSSSGSARTADRKWDETERMVGEEEGKARKEGNWEQWRVKKIRRTSIVQNFHVIFMALFTFILICRRVNAAVEESR